MIALRSFKLPGVHMIKERYFGLRYSSNIAFMLGYMPKVAAGQGLPEAQVWSQGSQVEADFKAAATAPEDEDEVPSIFR